MDSSNQVAQPFIPPNIYNPQFQQQQQQQYYNNPLPQYQANLPEQNSPSYYQGAIQGQAPVPSRFYDPNLGPPLARPISPSQPNYGQQYQTNIASPRQGYYQPSAQEVERRSPQRQLNDAPYYENARGRGRNSVSRDSYASRDYTPSLTPSRVEESDYTSARYTEERRPTRQSESPRRNATESYTVSEDNNGSRRDYDSDGSKAEASGSGSDWDSAEKRSAHERAQRAKKKRERKTESKFKGDLSTWGKEYEEPKYYYRRVPDDVSDATLSSGLSPRDQEKHAHFDIEQAKKTLAYTAGMYGKAQALRREGTAPASMGVPDDLPNRFAFQQLNILAGMAAKVQDAIEHNKKIFEQRIKMENRALMTNVFNAWRSSKYGDTAKQQLMRKVIARIMRGKLARAFFAWKDKFHLVDKYTMMRKKMVATLRFGLLKRSFLAWHNVVVERKWKTQLTTRDEMIRTMELKISGFQKRPILVLRRRKLRLCMYAWEQRIKGFIEKRDRFKRAANLFLKAGTRLLARAWNKWWEYHMECQRKKDVGNRVLKRMKNLKLSAAWNKWWSYVEARREKEKKTQRALRFWKNRPLAKAWNAWKLYVEQRKELRHILNKWKHPMLTRAWASWVDFVEWSKRCKVIVERTALRMRNRLLAKAWDTWHAAIHLRKMDDHISTKEELAIQVKELTAENEKLRRDNERFVRLIDSGEWGRGRVAELVAAGEILKGERDALLKLITSLRREYESVQMAKVNNEEEMKALKERMLLGGAARNRMLVKGGSSFNALVRAMKQDLVEVPPPQVNRDPNLLYEVDRLSMDHVTVFPDGQLNVQAVASNNSPPFARPASSPRMPNRIQPPVEPVQQMRAPAGLSGMAAVAAREAVGRSRAQSAAQNRAGMGPNAAEAAGPGPASRFPSQTAQYVVDALRNLSPGEVDAVKVALRQASDPRRPQGMTSTVPPHR